MLFFQTNTHSFIICIIISIFINIIIIIIIKKRHTEVISIHKYIEKNKIFLRFNIIIIIIMVEFVHILCILYEGENKIK